MANKDPLDPQPAAPFPLRLRPATQQTVGDVLLKRCPLSMKKIKEALTKGAVWLTRPGWNEKRIRKANFPVGPKDRIDIYYDEQILSRTAPSPLLISDQGAYSVWYKPAGLLSQGSPYGDHCSLTRHIEQQSLKQSDARLIHRLDREAFGLILIGHNRKGAAALTRLLQAGEIAKYYRAEVSGQLGQTGETLEFDQPLDEKPSRTTAEILRYLPEHDTTLLDIRLHTGRTHQIRRHLAGAGHPLIGDPRYGKPTPLLPELPLQLCAYRLAFHCPIHDRDLEFSLDRGFFTANTPDNSGGRLFLSVRKIIR